MAALEPIDENLAMAMASHASRFEDTTEER